MYKESLEDNNLFFTCSLVEYIARKTYNKKRDIVNLLGKNNILKIYNLADIYHTENIEKVSDEFIEKCNIVRGEYDILSNCQYRIPSYFEIGKVYKRLIIMINSDVNNYIDTLIDVLSSWIIEVIDNYNNSMYYENPDYIYQCYIEGKIL